MKALILAAGLGTRLLPHTRTLPKPLFTLLSRPMLAYTIQQLIDVRCEQIIINTHHLHLQIDQFIKKHDFGINIQTVYEPHILETGGAIANIKSFMDDTPFFVINADIISSIDLKQAYENHNQSNCLATLVLHDYQQFNKVEVDSQGYILNFNSKKNGLAFTGVQVLSHEIYHHLPDKKKFSSIEIYKALSAQKKVNASIQKDIFWSDIGTPKDYQMTSLRMLCAAQFDLPMNQIQNIKLTHLAGDGSDRQWFRANYKTQSIIISDHGICQPDTDNFLQLNAFVNIGQHLLSKAIAVPKILDHDTLSGMVILEDLGDTHLVNIIKNKNSNTETLKIYKQVIDQIIEFSADGIKEFDTNWTCQTQTYSKQLILDKECQYFIEQFVQGYLNLSTQFNALESEFNDIAEQALVYGYNGLMHRDMQSKNIMIKNNQLYFIDFQSARIGPLQYDLASLLIDPYVNLDELIKKELLNYTLKKLSLSPDQSNDFLHSFKFCCLTRNLQFLGAFSFLSQIKNKTNFEQYIPDAVNSLCQTLNTLDIKRFPNLHQLVNTIKTTTHLRR